ncbi:protein SPEC3-like [Strongylocentrotus purpuratus]|uniref:Protein SPEC3 n=1 Tax=Strongylocentrotus purpuratus TaxID=7668 RepID=A0A7M7RG79_STRPU|nr:protein SPEC3-like [Strongylocentrotus purpuratus]|eukprot:XP_793071.1 PREDICTED: protein SPEC3-like [Strongylocentrotus purpuratus]
MAQQQTTVVLAPTQPTIQTSVVIHKKEGNACRAAIPAMPMVMAVFCLIFNILVPGLGTIIAGFSVFCCGNPGQSGLGNCGTMCLNLFVGLLQLVLTVIFVGWIWSIMWGVAFIGMSHDYSQTNKTTTTLVTTRSPGPQALTVTQTQPQPQSQAYYPQPPLQHGYPNQHQGYAPPPQQGYAPPPQQGYAPPPQQGFAPPPQQGYAPPLQGTAPPMDSNFPPQNYSQQPAYNPYNQPDQQQPPPYTASELPPKKS